MMSRASVREWFYRAAGLFRRRQREQELADELEFHLALKKQSYAAHGETHANADRRAYKDFGGLDRWKECCRDIGTLRLVEDMMRDLRLAVRMLRKSPVFTVIAVTTLAAAIGANTTIFSLMNAVLLKSVAAPRPDRLALLRIQPSSYGYVFSYPWFRRIEKDAAGVMQTFGFASRSVQFRRVDGVEKIPCQLVSGGFFPAMQVSPKLGRYISTEDDRPGTPDGLVAVISSEFWRARFGENPRILGSKIILNQTVFTVVGVMPDSFRGMDRDQRPAVFLPLESEPALDAPFSNIAAGYQMWWMRIGGRLKDGISLQQAAAFLKAHSSVLTHGDDTPASLQFDGYKLSDLYISAEAGLTGYSYIRLEFAKPLVTLMVLVGLVLFVACLNLATLLIARAAARRREIATRFALGASRVRLVRQLLTECLLLCASGMAIGLPAALFLTRALIVLLAPQHGADSAQLDISLDWRLFAFTAATAVLATIVTGVAPALRSTNRNLESSLREGSTAIRGADRRHWWPRILLTSEVAVALMLVTGASLLGYSFLKLHQMPLGFEPAGLLHLTIDARHMNHQAALPEFYRQATERLKALPGVSDATFSQVVPLSNSVFQSGVTVPGGNEQPIWVNAVGPDYFATMRTKVLDGREFRWPDMDPARHIVILNASAVKLLFPSGGALGNHVFTDGKTPLEVIGIVEDAKYSSVREATPPTMYMTSGSQMEKASFLFLVRTNGPVTPLVRAASDAIHKMFPELPQPVAVTMADTLNESLASERILTILASFFGVLALLITGVGLYGTLAYMTERRTGEFGIRLALGASRREIASLVCAENGAIALAGSVTGVAASWMASKLIASFLFGITPRNPLAFGAAVLLLLTVGTAASLLPALKATRVDALSAIRHE